MRCLSLDGHGVTALCILATCMLKSGCTLDNCRHSLLLVQVLEEPLRMGKHEVVGSFLPAGKRAAEAGLT